MDINLSKNSAREVIFIGLPGPTHHYGGLSPDNVASDQNRGMESSPRQAALQAVALARHLFSLGIEVAILPPHLRPFLTSREVYDVQKLPVEILRQISSSSFMWAANAATITPVTDSTDHKLHITIANLHTNSHRRIEAQVTYNVLKQIFKDVPDTQVHAPLEQKKGFLDEGAANHMRLSPTHGDKGLNIFVYGRRQNLEASKAVIENHKIFSGQNLLIEQDPEIIQKGVFHNDVIGVSNKNLLLIHASSYKNGSKDIEAIKQAYNQLYPHNLLQLIVIENEELSVEEAVATYFFNSQIITKADGNMAVIAPTELKDLYGGKAAKVMENIRANKGNSINEIYYLNLKQSMRNGGGPACLRLRVVLSANQLSALKSANNVICNAESFAELENIISEYYPETMTIEGLRNPELYKKGHDLLIELGKLMAISL